VPGPIIVPPDTAACRGELQLWKSEGEKLALFCQRLGLERPWVFSHSHGLQLVAYAAAGTDFVFAQRFATAISLSGVVRDDMTWTRQRAAAHIERWVQIVDPDDDQIIREGQMFDGRLGWQYELPRTSSYRAAATAASPRTSTPGSGSGCSSTCNRSGTGHHGSGNGVSPAVISRRRYPEH
jgi:hypothetical protein